MSVTEGRWLFTSRSILRTFEFADPRETNTAESDPVRVIRRNEVSGSRKEAAKFFDALEKAAFWHGPSWQDSGVDDGTAILIEARKSGIYHSATRRTADAGAFVAAKELIHAAGMRVPPELEDTIYRLERRGDTGLLLK